VPGVPHLLYTDAPNIKAKGWEVLPIPAELKGLDKRQQARMLKHLPHRYLPSEFTTSLWQDGNMQQAKSIAPLLDTPAPFMVDKHAARWCFYDEVAACRKLKKDARDTLSYAETLAKSIGLPKGVRPWQTGVMVRHHHEPEVVRFQEQWAWAVLNVSIRDQVCAPILQHLVRLPRILVVDYLFQYYERTKHQA
jgi:hypothetical protein